MIRALIFDMDWTLVDSEKLHVKAWRTIRVRCGIDSIPEDDLNRYAGNSNEQFLASLSGTLD